jgi:hypothetical protein
MIAALLAGLTTPPRVEFQWAAPTLEISLADEKTHVQRLSVTNHTNNTVLLFSADFWVNHALTIRTVAGDPVALTPNGIAAYHRLGSVRRDHNVPITLYSGKTWSYRTPALPTFFELTPGEYTITVRYQDRGYDDEPVILDSNKGKLVVRP